MTNLNKKLIVLVSLLVFLLGFVALVRLTGWGTGVIWEASGQGQLLLPLVAVAAVIDSINPCAFSILLLTVAFLFALGRVRRDIIKIGGFYIFGIFLAYFLIGLGILQTLQFFGVPHFMSKLAAGLLMGLGGINLLNSFFPKLPLKLEIPHFAHRQLAYFIKKASLPSAFLLGGLVGLCEFPCTGGPYLLVLGLLHDQSTFWQGLGYLLFYNALFVLPLVLLLGIAANEDLLNKVRSFQIREKSKMRLISGAAMVLLGLLIFII